MDLAPETERALAACFDALGDPSLWPQRLQRLGESMGARSLVIRATTERHDPSAPRHLQSTGHDAFADLWIRRQAEAPDPHTGLGGLALCADLCHRQVELFDQDLFRPRDRERMAYFRAVAAPGRRDWWAGMSFAAGGELWVLSLFRAAEDGPFPRSHRPLFAELRRRLPRLLQVAQGVRRAADLRLVEALGLLGLPVALLAGDGVVLGLSEPLKALIGPDLWVSQGRLATPQPGVARALARLAQAATSPVTPCRPVVLLRDGEPWLIAEGLALPEAGRARFEGARGAVAFRELGARAGDAGLLAEAYGLTPAEARVAAVLAAGLSTASMSRQFGVSRETIRSQLKAMSRKTGATGRAQLAALLTRTSA